MAAKITVTLKQDENGTPQAMAETIAILSSLGPQAPLTKLTLVLECEDEDLEMHRDELRVLLGGRPVGVDVELKAESKESVERGRMVRVTPMDKAWSN
jgi:hypothetical protein